MTRIEAIREINERLRLLPASVRSLEFHSVVETETIRNIDGSTYQAPGKAKLQITLSYNYEARRGE